MLKERKGRFQLQPAVGKLAMNLKPFISITVTMAIGVVGAALPTPRTLAQSSGESRPATSTSVATQLPPQIIQYQCYDSRGNLAFVTFNPQETYGWAQGCREVPYMDVEKPEATVPYYRCFDAKGNILLTTVNREDAEKLIQQDVTCNLVAERSSSPPQNYAVYYECFNFEGQVAFTTRFPQDTVGWLPGCRELTTRTLPAGTPPGPSSPQNSAPQQ